MVRFKPWLVPPGSDSKGEFGKGRREPVSQVHVGREFIVTTTEILHERVSRTDYPG